MSSVLAGVLNANPPGRTSSLGQETGANTWTPVSAGVPPAEDLYYYDTIHRMPELVNHTKERSLLDRFLFVGDDMFQPVATLSFGQRSRLMLVRLVEHTEVFIIG